MKYIKKLDKKNFQLKRTAIKALKAKVKYIKNIIQPKTKKKKKEESKKMEINIKLIKIKKKLMINKIMNKMKLLNEKNYFFLINSV